MNNKLRVLGVIILILVCLILGLGLYLNRGLSVEIEPAEFDCLDMTQGTFATFDTLPKTIYGIGLAYAGHINETASDFDPEGDPPIFKKAVSSIAYNNAIVREPSHDQLVNAIDELESGLKSSLDREYNPLPALVDYEVEMGFVLLEDVTDVQLTSNNFAPKLGYFIANDISARSLAILGEGRENRYDYWGVSKSFDGFTPVGDQVWIPKRSSPNSIPCIRITTEVNNDKRQDQMTSDLIYTPLFMLQAIKRKYPEAILNKGDWILTGTPGGVVFSAPRWLVRLAGMLGMDRYAKLGASTGSDDAAKFLQPGDKVTTVGEHLGEVSITIAKSN